MIIPRLAAIQIAVAVLKIAVVDLQIILRFSQVPSEFLQSLS